MKSDQFGLVCPFESPESESIGLTKNLSIGAWVSIQHPREELIDIILEILPKEDDGNAKVEVIVCGVPIGRFPHDESLHTTAQGPQGQPLYFDVCINNNVEEGALRSTETVERLCRPLIKLVDERFFTDADWNTRGSWIWWRRVSSSSFTRRSSYQHEGVFEPI